MYVCISIYTNRNLEQEEKSLSEIHWNWLCYEPASLFFLSRRLVRNTVFSTLFFLSSTRDHDVIVVCSRDGSPNYCLYVTDHSRG